ncbi:FAD binding domain of DNA photolyase family protein [Burkholderia thailandensis MSMB121]|nr:FAD binding domain of DNA photolyase family protein [Burkholderia thailandensis MSMB121]
MREAWRFGEDAAHRAATQADLDTFLSELGWREFCWAQPYRFPDLPRRSLRHTLDGMPWRDDPAALAAWRRGATDYPLVDADAAPYFRIFNPVAQGRRFDSDGAYVRRWAPELAGLPPAALREPWAAPPAQFAAAGVRLGDTYPMPIVAHDAARRRALDSICDNPMKPVLEHLIFCN